METSSSLLQAVPAIALTLACGISICLGWILPLDRLARTPTLFCLCTALAAGMMTCLGLHAMVEAWSLLALFLFACGWAGILALDHLLHREGHHSEAPTPCSVSACLVPAVALGLHNVTDCFFVLNTAMCNLSLGAWLTLAMALHNAPLGISLGLAANNMRASLRACSILLAGGMPVLLSCLLFFCLQAFFPHEVIENISPLAGGALCAIALRQLLPQAREQGSLLRTGLGFGLGFALLCLIVHCLHHEGM